MSALEVMGLLNPKSQSFKPVGGGGTPDVTWQDVCGAIASLPSVLQDFAYLLHNSRLGREKLDFVKAVSVIVLQEVQQSGIKCRLQKLSDLCEAIAHTAVVRVLNPNLSMTRAERMATGGVTLSENAYRARWEHFEIMMVDRLMSWQAQIEWIVADYINATRRQCVEA